MNTRQKNIIQELINFENNTITNLATMYAVSYRTIQNDIQLINSEIKEYAVQIVSATNKGIYVKADDPNLLKSLINYLDEDSKYEDADLTYRILENVISSSDYIKISDFPEKYYVGKKTVDNCMINVKNILIRYNLKLISKPSYGCYLKGNDGQTEAKVRRMIFALKKKEKTFYPLLIGENEKQLISETIKKQCMLSHYFTTEESLQDLILGIYIAITRMKQHKFIDYEQSLVGYLTELEEYKTASLIAENITQITSLNYEIREIAYISRIMRAHRRLTSQDIEKLENNIRADLDRLIVKILDEIADKYQADFHDDFDLYISLGMHLVPLISRIKFNFHINNPMVNEVKRNYMLAFDMATTAAKVIENEFDIKLSEDEIGYLAVHLNLAIERKKHDTIPKNVLIVCSSGGGLSKLLEFKVKRNFADRINKIKTCNMYELKNIDLSQFDYVLTTVKLNCELSKPTLQISHMLTDEDVDNFNEVLNVTENKKSLIDIATETIFFNDIKALNKIDALEQIIARLRNILPLQGDFMQQILKREELYSTEIGNNVVFPHPLESKTPISFISICVLKKAIKWENEYVRVIMIANSKVGEGEKLQLMYQQFAQFISNKQNIIDLIKKPTYETFKELVERKNKYE